MSFVQIVTVGPGLLDRDKLNSIQAVGEVIFRLNGAHLNALQAKDMINSIKSLAPRSRVMLDLPGNKVRTGILSEGIRLVSGKTFSLTPSQINFADFHKYLHVGDIVFANDAIFRLEVTAIENGVITFISHSDGLLTSNKGFHVKGVSAQLPFLFERDRELVKAGVEANVDVISLSFLRDVSDYKMASDLIQSFGGKSDIFVKIETELALENIEAIVMAAKYFNIDRGDLSSDVGILNLPKAIARIKSTTDKHKKPLFIATQFLKSMELSPVPYLSEVTELFRTVEQGFAGIQLSEETAVGKYPLECVQMVRDIVQSVKG